MKSSKVKLFLHSSLLWSLSVFITTALFYTRITPISVAKQKQQRDLIIRVLLDEADAKKSRKIIILSDDGFILESPMGSKKQHKTKKNILSLIVKNNTMYLQCNDGKYRRIKYDDLAVSPLNGVLHIGKYSYQGTLDLRLNKQDKILQLINKLPLSDYLYSVLLNESLSYWPIEMQKVQAVASRTYALYQMKQTRLQKNAANIHYDIKNTNFHQVYNGNHKYTHLRQAVLDTHNEIVFHNNNIALTMFDICCGGIIPSNMKKKDDDKPYLFRKNRCTYCKRKPNFTWKERFNLKNFLQRLKNNSRVAKKIAAIKNIIGIRVHEKDKAGIVHSVLVAGPERKAVITVNDLKKSLPCNLKSMAFDIKKHGASIVIDGMGFGHNIGLCQLGARELVARGWDYKEILEFYYPETEVRQLRL